MRLMLSTLVAAALMSGPVAAAECTRPAEHVAIDLTALKTQLMVMALTCQSDERYNAFISKYKTDLTQADKSLTGYFTRSSRNGAKLRDDYVTQLANSQSQTGLRQGTAYCTHNLPVFDEVMALRNADELSEYAAAKSTQEQPIPIHDCTGAAPTTTPHATHIAARHR